MPAEIGIHLFKLRFHTRGVHLHLPITFGNIFLFRYALDWSYGSCIQTIQPMDSEEAAPTREARSRRALSGGSTTQLFRFPATRSPWRSRKPGWLRLARHAWP